MRHVKNEKRRAMFRCAILATSIGGAWLAPKASAAVIYDAGGFDSAVRYNPALVTDSVVGNLRGQDSVTIGGAGKWLEAASALGTAAGAVATVKTSGSIPVASGTQAIQISRTLSGTDVRWAPDVTFTPGTTTTRLVRVDWSQRVTQASTSTSVFGPFFGVEAYGGGGRLGGLGVDATTGELLWETPSSFAAGPAISFDQYHTFDLAFDFASQQYSVTVDGVQQASGLSFLNASTTFTDADVAALRAAAGAADQPTGTAYVDNYIITAVPEPTALSLVAGATMCVLARRRRRSV